METNLTTGPTLFPEIIAEIIDIVVHDTTSKYKWNRLWRLKSLSCVSKFFCNQIRKNIFQSIAVGNETVLDFDYNDLPINRLCTPSISQFVFLVFEHPDVAPHIQRLYIQFPNVDEIPLLNEVLESLVNLKCFNLVRRQWQQKNLWDPAMAQTRCFQTLTRLGSLNQLELVNVRDVPFHILAERAGLQKLLMRGASFSITPRSAHAIGKVTSVPVIHREPLVDLSKLSMLHFELTCREGAEDVAHFLESVKLESLERLSFVIDTYVDDNGPESDWQSTEETIEFKLHPREIEQWVLPYRGTLTHLDASFRTADHVQDLYCGLCGVLDSMAAGDNVLRDLKVVVNKFHTKNQGLEIADSEEANLNGEVVIGDEWKSLTKALMKRGWKDLERVVVKVTLNEMQVQGRSFEDIFGPLSSSYFEFDLQIVP